MTYEKALELANEEINFVRSENRFRNKDLRKIYYQYEGNLIEHREQFLELFAEYIFLTESPLGKALK
jgi:hypothetical protein